MQNKFKLILIGFSLMLFCSTVGSAANVTADFTANITTGTVPFNVGFSDQSVNATSWSWTFGDGVTSIDKDPIHTYVSAGTYDVSLTAINGTENDTETKTGYITVNSATAFPVAQFSASTTSGIVPLTVNFTDTSSNAGNWSWTFGDGNTSFDRNASHIYTSEGIYDVSLTVTNANGTDTETKTDYITVNNATTFPVAQFSASTTSGIVPLTVNFTDTSSNAGNWSWTFGDGNTSFDRNASHIYTSEGIYDVSLTVTNANGTDTETKTDYITVNNATAFPVAQFSASTTSGIVPLTVNFTDTSSNAGNWSWTFGDGNTSFDRNASHIYTSEGIYDVSLTVTNANGTDTETKTDYITVNNATTFPVAQFSASTTSGIVPLTVNFTDTSSNAGNWSWTFGDGNTSFDRNASHIYTSEGIYDVSLTVTNANGTDTETKTDYITVNASSSNPPVASFDTNVTEGTVPLAVMFNDTSSNTPTSWSWAFGDGKNSTEQHPIHTYTSTGEFNVSLTATNGDGSDTINKTIKVYSKTYFTGDRIWDGDNADQSRDKYTWDAKSFSGFFYDLESGLSSESLTISNIDRSLGSGDILYQTAPVDTDFERNDWGKFNVIGFMAEEYFAGYTDNTSIDGVEEVSMISSGQLSKILINNDEKETVYSGSSIILEDGYELNIVQVDLNGDQVLVTLTKDGDEVDTGIVSSNDDYVYKKDLGDADDVIILVVHFNQIFQGRESNMVVVEGIFQISDEYLELESGDSYGDMEITRIDDDLIEMENDGSVSLSKGKSINLMGKIKLLVADNDDLRFAPVVDMSEPGTYELRGTVAEGDELLTWTPLNFEGFYYDIDEGIQTETLELTAISGNSIKSGDLVYTSTPASVEFEHSEWGKFNVMGFMAEKYFAGYTAATDVDGVSALNLISDGQLSKVLVDEDSKVSVSSGSELVLEEGYTLQIAQVDVNGESVLINLYKDGDEVDTDIVSANDDYVFEKDLGDADDVPIIIIHFDEVFSGRESDAIFVEGMFQISEDYITLETGGNYGDMEIDSFGDSIVMSNDGSISLNKDKEIKLMDNVMIKVADSDTLRYYPFVEVKTAASETLNIELSQSTVVQGEEITISVNARGASIANATVKVEGKTIGTTDSDGTLVHTFSETGTFEITAERDDYATASEDIEVIGKDDETKKMSIEVSPDEVYEGTPMTIFVLKAIGGDGIQGANVTFDKKIIGTTDDDGTINYTATEAGTHKITASKPGLLDAEYDLRVDELAAKFKFSNIVITPLEIKQGKEATISVDVVNTGTAAGEYNVELKVNDAVVDSQLISLSVGNSTTLEFSHVEENPGTYEVEIGGITTTYEVFEKCSTWLYILGAIALAAIGGIAYLFTAGGWTVEIAQAKVAEAIESIKELVGNIR